MSNNFGKRWFKKVKTGLHTVRLLSALHFSNMHYESERREYGVFLKELSQNYFPFQWSVKYLLENVQETLFENLLHK